MVSIITLGCPKNSADSNNLVKLLTEEGITCTESPDDADVILVNTCGFIKEAREESVNEILNCIEYKENGKKIIVFGCLAQRYKEELEREIPEIDALWGIDQESNIVDSCKQFLLSHRPTGRKQSENIKHCLSESELFIYLKIAEGCDRRCSFCVIPSIRGKYRSESPDRILKKAEKAISDGRKELILIAQDITSYGHDIDYSLARLVKELASISGDFWIRLMYLYPTSIGDDLIDAVYSEEKVCKYLDIPFQHSEDKILKEMGRGGTRSFYIDMIKSLRAALPDLVLRSSFIVGFPGETRKEFSALLSFIEEAEIDRLGVFGYSDEEGTPASLLPHKISDVFIKKRIHELMSLQVAIAKERNKRFVGREFKALIDEADYNQTIARLYSHAPEIDGNVIIDGYAQNKTDFLRVTITGAAEYDLTGKLLS